MPPEAASVVVYGVPTCPGGSEVVVMLNVVGGDIASPSPEQPKIKAAAATARIA